eukprot:CAMPEP_0169140674 /NCGR_PEP_ID=MMETSP1015-20121227/43760_1 /TAXON_ID=342587 /ORGANISM="Karlodinium micrum, Strain CCMP2283" /LENGTH=233 /DNA_ID=CAMNT_0009206725 /DNA_START=136 /DNA_END=834 /DNA_ORIENTATION=+
MEQVFFSKSSDDSLSQLMDFRVDVRNVVLELSGWSDAVSCSSWPLGDGTKSREKRNFLNGGLDTSIDSDGVGEIFVEIGVPSHIATALVERLLLLDAACSTASGFSISSLKTLRSLLGLMRRAREFLKSHVDAFLGPCLAMRVDMVAVFTKASISSGERMPMEELVALMRREGIDFAATDLQEVSQALDMDSEGRILVAEVLRRYQELVGRHGAVLSQLADGLETGVPDGAIK